MIIQKKKKIKNYPLCKKKNFQDTHKLFHLYFDDRTAVQGSTMSDNYYIGCTDKHLTRLKNRNVKLISLRLHVN